METSLGILVEKSGQVEEKEIPTVKLVTNLTCILMHSLRAHTANILGSEVFVLCRSFSKTTRLVEYLLHLLLQFLTPVTIAFHLSQLMEGVHFPDGLVSHLQGVPGY